MARDRCAEYRGLVAFAFAVDASSRDATIDEGIAVALSSALEPSLGIARVTPDQVRWIITRVGEGSFDDYLEKSDPNKLSDAAHCFADLMPPREVRGEEIRTAQLRDARNLLIACLDAVSRKRHVYRDSDGNAFRIGAADDV